MIQDNSDTDALAAFSALANTEGQVCWEPFTLSRTVMG